MPVFVAEYGFPEWKEYDKELGDQLFDQARPDYYRLFLDAMLKAIHEDKVDVIGSLAWSFQDNWEFGNPEQFGMQVVNTTTQERFFKK
jgi:beta-glucosidase/6-phospho-beta-glucosidase/beta-galactosidase